MTRIHRACLVLGIWSVICVVAVASKAHFGIAPQDLKYYKSEIINCKNGSKKFTKAQLNDDFCDCSDGTDEPGTSACPEGKFFCHNAGHLPISLFSSRVNDGICDCCDGSDEYDGNISCPNTCWEAGKMARDELKKKIATYQEGVTKREHIVEKAKRAVAKDEAELSNLQSEEKMLEMLLKKLKERKEQIEAVEEQQRLRKEKEEKPKEEAREKGDQEKVEAEDKADVEKEVEKNLDDDKIGLLEESPEDQHEKDESENSDESANTEGLSREELGRIVASRWTGENTGRQAKEVNTAKDDHGDINDTPQSVDKDSDNYGSEVNKENSKDGEDDMEKNMNEKTVADNPDGSSSPHTHDSEDKDDISDITTSNIPSWLDKIQQTVRNIFQAVNLFETPVDISDADSVRKEYDESTTKLSEIQSKISSLTEKLKHDFGVDKEFYSLYDRCFETKQNKYTYKVCPFKQASQEEGHSITQLGYWEKFENSYGMMLFSNGNNCWNGPDRSLKVKLRCGLKTELTDIDEPSRCEYEAQMSTPALCLEEKLKELEHELKLMNEEQPPSHDEL